MKEESTLRNERKTKGAEIKILNRFRQMPGCMELWEERCGEGGILRHLCYVCICQYNLFFLVLSINISG